MICPVDVPPTLALRGIPAVAIPGRTITAGLERVGETDVGDTSTLGVYDERGVGWQAKFPYVFTSQEFSVGLNGPFKVTATYTECCRRARASGRFRLICRSSAGSTR